MYRLLACRVCLAYDTRLCSITDGKLREIYEKLVEASLDTEEMLPMSVCYVCYSLMKKMLQFRDRSQKANQILQQMISSGLEPSVSSLDMLMKDQTGISWSLGLSDVVRTTTTSAVDKVKVKIESVESEIDIVGMSDRNEVTKPDSREIVLSKEDQQQGMCERAKSIEYQNSPFRCDFCSEAFVDARAYENHKEKHDEPSVSCLDILDWHNRQTGISYPLEISDIKRTTPTTGEFEFKVKIESVESEMDIDEMSDRNEGAAPPENRKLDKYEAVNELVNIQALLRNTEKDEEPKEKKEIKEEIPDSIYSDLNVTNEYKILNLLRVHEIGKRNDNRKENFRHKNKFRDNTSLYECQYCMKRFLYNSRLILHLRVHTKEKPFKCDICERVFSRNDHLTKHLRVHTKEKPYKCHICEKGFSRNETLTQHFSVHTKEKPFKCDICEKGFSRNDHLTKHLSVHAKEKPFKCYRCEKGFCRRKSLTEHLRVHTKERPFK